MEKAGFAKRITSQKELKETLASFFSKPDELIEKKKEDVILFFVHHANIWMI